MFGFVKQIFISVIIFFGCGQPSVNSLKCISMTNEECKVRPQVAHANSDKPVFYLLVLKEVNEVVVVTISVTHMQKCVFLML